MLNAAVGVVLPMPTNPLLSTVKMDVVEFDVDDDTSKRRVAVSPLLALIAIRAQGDDVPTPILDVKTFTPVNVFVLYIVGTVVDDWK